MADDRVAAAVAELYGADPAAFTGRRGELAAAARTAGDRDAAKVIAALRKPTRTAWVVNTLARADPGAPAKLAELAAALLAAEQARNGERLRELSAARGPLIDALTDEALTAADVPEPPPSLRAEVAATLTAALADPEVYSAFAAGRLTSAVQWAGFGFGLETGATGLDAGLTPGPEAGLAAGPEVGLAGGTTAAAASRTSPAAPEPHAKPAASSSPSSPSPSSPSPAPLATVTPLSRSRARRSAASAEATAEATARRMAEEAERVASAAEERAAAARARYEDAERTAVTASSASAEAVAAEDRLEAEVRDLEERLVKAREDLTAARMRARRAEAAERRARQVLDRLPRPE